MVYRANHHSCLATVSFLRKIKNQWEDTRTDEEGDELNTEPNRFHLLGNVETVRTNSL